MGYHPMTRSPRDYGRESRTPKREKAKAKERKHGSASASSIWEEGHVATAQEVADRTLSQIRTLGSQKFAFSPYGGHLARWLANLKGVLSEFGSNSIIGVDEQFVNERSQILSSVELQLEERRRKEASSEEVVKILSENRILLEQIGEAYVTKASEIEDRKKSEIKQLNSNINSLKRELDDIAQMKTGLFRGISKKAKAEKEAEATERLDAAEKELALAELNFNAEQGRLRDEYERRKQSIIELIKDRQKEIDDLEIDGSLEDRRVACEALAKAVNALVQRKASPSH